MNTYAQFAEYLGKKNERPVGNNTRARFITETVPDATGQHPRINRGVAVKLHGTDVVTLWEDGRVILNSGGYRTSTTKARINEHGPVTVWQHRGVWSFNHRGASHYHRGASHLFADGVTIHPDGSVTGAASPSDDEAAKALRKRINTFAKLCGSQEFPLPHPGAGDCFYCQMREVSTGKPLGEVTKDTSHIVSHMDEGYIVPSLVWNALEHAGYHPGRQIAHAAVFNADMGAMKDFAAGAVTRSVRKYLLRQFSLA